MFRGKAEVLRTGMLHKRSAWMYNTEDSNQLEPISL